MPSEVDDSFDDEDEDMAAALGLPGLPVVDTGMSNHNAELELRMAEMNVEIAGLKQQTLSLTQQNGRLRAAYESEVERKRAVEEEVKGLREQLAVQKKKEIEDNKALESALLAIEAKLEAANGRTKEAEAEANTLRRRLDELGGGGKVADQLQAANSKLNRGRKKKRKKRGISL
jgi:chromosome segregation ATPase